MKKFFKHSIIGIIVITLLFIYTAKISLNLKNENIQKIYQSETTLSKEPVVFLQYFDWFEEDSWREDEFVDKLDWHSIGIEGDDRKSEEFYYKQFRYIKSLGVDALAWEYHPRKGGKHPLYPSEEALRAMKRAGLRVAPFFDMEIAIQVVKDQEFLPTLSSTGMIKPNKETVQLIMSYLELFYELVPKDLWACDAKGRTVVYVYGYDFNDESEPNEWEEFAGTLVQSLKEVVGEHPVFYWSYKNSSFAEHLFLNHREYFVPFQFVLDTPQGQFGHDSVTWNFGFDNLGVQVRDGLKRVIRLDKRYLKEMGWLAGATNPAAIFVYGWNEPFEGSIIMPTEEWGDTKARLLKFYIDRVKNGNDKPLKDVLLIVDNLDNYYMQGGNDWHYLIERELLLYSMRRFVPQSDVYMVDELTEELLDQYGSIVDISVDKTTEQREWLLDRMLSHQILCFDPKAIYDDTTLVDYFMEPLGAWNINSDVQILGSLTRKSVDMFARDDIIRTNALTTNTHSLLNVFAWGKENPLVVSNGDDIFVNSYNTVELILKTAFEEFYGIDLQKSIMYGEGYLSQRLEIDSLGAEPIRNRLERYSINQYWDIPEGIQWDVMPQYVDDKFKKFIFGS